MKRRVVFLCYVQAEERKEERRGERGGGTETRGREETRPSFPSSALWVRFRCRRGLDANLLNSSRSGDDGGNAGGGVDTVKRGRGERKGRVSFENSGRRRRTEREEGLMKSRRVNVRVGVRDGGEGSDSREIGSVAVDED